MAYGSKDIGALRQRASQVARNPSAPGIAARPGMRPMLPSEGGQVRPGQMMGPRPMAPRPTLSAPVGGPTAMPGPPLTSVPPPPPGPPGGGDWSAPRYADMAARLGPDVAAQRQAAFQAGSLPGQQGEAKGPEQMTPQPMPFGGIGAAYGPPPGPGGFSGSAGGPGAMGAPPDQAFSGANGAVGRPSPVGAMPGPGGAPGMPQGGGFSPQMLQMLQQRFSAMQPGGPQGMPVQPQSQPSPYGGGAPVNFGR
jgi:hypothetical protein